MPAPWTWCRLAGLGLAAGEVPVHAVSKRAAGTGWIAPDQTRPIRHKVRLERFGPRGGPHRRCPPVAAAHSRCCRWSISVCPAPCGGPGAGLSTACVESW